ncbi:hypothetical protein KJ611_02430 [Patescibacteria group bacterium]|nr:hypothetical protein [Patescibacteria group bacterium]MBU1705901.1 hypothetical protein [Patescibacteria group bacterium]
MAQIIKLFDNPITDKLFFDQIKEIKAVLVRDNQLRVRMLTAPVPRTQPDTRDLFDLCAPSRLNAEAGRLVSPPEHCAEKLWCNMWLPGHKESEIKVRFAKVERSGHDLILISKDIRGGISDLLLLSKSTMLWIHGPDNRSWLANFSEISTGNTLFI